MSEQGLDAADEGDHEAAYDDRDAVDGAAGCADDGAAALLQQVKENRCFNLGIEHALT